MTELGPRLLLLAALVCVGVGIVDAAVSTEWDLLAVFAITAVLLVMMWARQRLHRVTVSLRPDLAHWIERRAESAGEPFDDVLDRAVATFRHGLVGDRPLSEDPVGDEVPVDQHPVGHQSVDHHPAGEDLVGDASAGDDRPR